MTQQGSAAAERPRSFLACIIYFSNTMRGSWSVWCVHIQSQQQHPWHSRTGILDTPVCSSTPPPLVWRLRSVLKSHRCLCLGIFFMIQFYCWLAFLFINKSPFTASTLFMDCSNHRLLDLGFLFGWLWVCSRNSHFLWYVLYVNSAPRRFASVSSCLAYNVPL